MLCSGCVGFPVHERAGADDHITVSLGLRAAVAAAAGAAVVLAAPFAQVAAEAVSGRRRTVVVVAPIVIVLLFAVYRIRSRPLSRYGALLASAVLGGGYVIGAGLTSGEAFHFAEYGAVALLFFWACRPLEDWSVVVLPVLAAVVFGTFDEWYQWFVPIRAGEARDVAINAVSGVCGVLAGIAIAPPERPWRGGAAAANRVAAWSAVTVVTFALFFYCVHIGYEIVDPAVGTFRSRYPLARLQAIAAERTAAWRTNPPLTLRRVSREDQYLT
jgi:hypothetical protein